jgi:hypothetical protein
MKSLPFLFLLLTVCFAYAYYDNSTAAPEMTRCVDYQDHVVSNAFCQVAPQSIRVPGSMYPLARYRRYYGGFGSFDPGSTAWGGSDRPLAGHLYRAAAGDESVATTPAAATAPDFYLGAAHGGH